MPDPTLIEDGRRHGIAVTDYLLERIRYGKLTVPAATAIVATNVEKHANEMLVRAEPRPT